MSGRSEIWTWLEIEPTSDIRKIKRAYAKQAAKYHPEDSPEEFQKIRGAYEAAIQIAKSESSVQDEFVTADFTEIREKTEGPSVQAEPETDPVVQEEDSDRIWQKAAKIGTLAEKYAREERQRKTRSSLYHVFLPEIALDKLDFFLKTRGRRSHEAWCEYLQEPIFLEAVHDPYFLSRLADRIGMQDMEKKTRLRIREVLEKEIPDQLAVQEKLQRALAGEKMLSEKDRRINRNRRIVLIILICFLLAGLAVNIREYTEANRIEEEIRVKPEEDIK